MVSEAISLLLIKTTGFKFRADESYLVLLVYRKSSLGSEFVESLPNSTWTLIESYADLTPRGLDVPLSTSEPLQDLNRVGRVSAANHGQLHHPVDWEERRRKARIHDFRVERESHRSQGQGTPS